MLFISNYRNCVNVNNKPPRISAVSEFKNLAQICLNTSAFELVHVPL